MELIVVACLVGAPATCAEHRLRLDVIGLDAAQCVYSSPPRIARWQIEHPKWKVTGWRCSRTAADEFA